MSRAFYPNQLIGEYRILDFLGAGGMGEVYRAEHTKIRRVAAVKVLTQATESSGFVERFFNEADIQANLHHPNIATLYDFREEGGMPCIIMEYVDGVTVADRIQQLRGPLPLAESAYVFEKVVEAVDYIHRHGIIHRDIKSNNIKISARGEVKLLDFGIAKGQMSPGLTQDGSVIGTLHYLAPELIRGGVADQRGDIWALGVLLYEMVTGCVPFHADTIGDLCDQIKRVAYAPPAQLNPGLPREVTGVIARCLKERPADRYRDAAELLRDARALSAAASRVGATAEAFVPPPEARASGGLGKPAVIGGAAVVLVLLLLAGGAGLFMLTSSSTPADGNVNGHGLVETGNGNAGAGGEAGRGGEHTIELHTSVGQAEVYRDGRRIGRTPFPMTTRVGDRVRLTLKLEGYADETVDFTVSGNKKIYTFTMKK